MKEKISIEDLETIKSQIAALDVLHFALSKGIPTEYQLELTKETLKHVNKNLKRIFNTSDDEPKIKE